ncbi:TetR/AcrR family transcriptional regulator [Rhizobium sp. RM]|uniref:TetR/AcrR family transcriptional regulator n=1 Tax=Rhizobium sp. RM TaxID=2748079 RepID=UPI00110DFCF6|nr:TetR/AcrR family transcriptional regulator [Rhizobium sp. RM]NWJ25916.1 TetR/AcrR family transcriptional regulator [Rhizobium sp. RM]TMV15804.1 TetR/AcrR family transcriptional regulator [Rhizobium sp. Td3]
MENAPPDTPEKPAERSRGRPKIYSDEQRRQTILDEARRTFTEEGFRRTTIAKVAARCKISKQTIYESFESKVDLFKAVVGDHRRMMLDLPRPADEDAPVDIVIERIFRIDIDEEMDAERDSFLSIIFAESKEVPELFDFIRDEGADPSRRDLVDWLKNQIERGRLKIDNPESGARMLMDMLLGPTGPGRRDWATLEDRRRHLRWCIDFFMASAAAR